MTADARTQQRYDFAAAAYRYAERRCHDEIESEQATQREITAWSFAVLRGARPDIQAFTNLLIQYEQPGTDEPGQIAPHNFVVVHPEPIDPGASFDIPFEPAGPLIVLDYLTERERKYETEDRDTYVRSLKVPYYLLFYPASADLSVFRLAGERYVTAMANAAGRLPIPELELEVGLLDGWVRYWFGGELLPLPGDVLRLLNVAEAELARLREELARTEGDSG